LHLLQQLAVDAAAVQAAALEHLADLVVVQVMTMAMQPQAVALAQPDKEIVVDTVLREVAMLLQVVVVVQEELELAATLMAQI
jgi:hypothetical protein